MSIPPFITPTWTRAGRLIAALFLSALGNSFLNAQTTAYTTPSGIYTVKVAGQVPGGIPARTYLGIQLLPDKRFQGRVAGVTGNNLSFEWLPDPQSLQDPDRKSYLHVLEGSGKGFISDIETFNTNNLTCAAILTPWIQPGTSVMVRPHSNLADIFGANNSYGLGAANDADLTDNIVVFDPISQQERVYYFNSTRVRWEQKGIIADASKATMRYPYGLYIVRRTPGTLRIALSGDVASQSVLLPVSPGFNVFSLPINLSASLTNWISSSGSHSVDKGQNAKTADLLTLYEPTTSNQRGPFYFFSQENVDAWRRVGLNNSTEASQALDYLSTLVLQRDGPAGYILANGSLVLGPTINLPADPEPGELPLFGELRGPRLGLEVDIQVQVEISTNLQNWSVLAEQASMQILPNGNWRFLLPAGQKRAFYRLRVSIVPF